MAQQTINVGTTANDGNGDALRNAFIKTNDNFTDLYTNKQATLVSGTNIKTVEGQSLLGSGNIDLTKSDVGLGNVDNTSDANKPVSTAQNTAINAKVSDAIVNGVTTVAPSQNAVFDALALKQDVLTNPITGTGTSDKIAKFSSAGVLTDSLITDVSGSLTYTNDLYDTGFKFENSVKVGYDINVNPIGLFANIDEAVFTNEGGHKFGIHGNGKYLVASTMIMDSGDTPSDPYTPVRWMKIYDTDTTQFFFIPIYQ